jgi:hypothetical protein
VSRAAPQLEPDAVVAVAVGDPGVLVAVIVEVLVAVPVFVGEEVGLPEVGVGVLVLVGVGVWVKVKVFVGVGTQVTINETDPEVAVPPE